MNWTELFINVVVILVCWGLTFVYSKKWAESKKWIDANQKSKLKKILSWIGGIVILSFFMAAVRIGITGNENDFDLKLGIKVFIVLSISVLSGVLFAKKKIK